MTEQLLLSDARLAHFDWVLLGSGGISMTGHLSESSCRESRLEQGYRCDWKEAAVTGISTGRGLVHGEGHSATLFGLYLE